MAEAFPETPWVLCLRDPVEVGVSLLRNANVVPPEIELLKEAAALERQLAGANPARARETNARLQEVRVTFSMAMERRARTSREA